MAVVEDMLRLPEAAPDMIPVEDPSVPKAAMLAMSTQAVPAKAAPHKAHNGTNPTGDNKQNPMTG